MHNRDEEPENASSVTSHPLPAEKQRPPEQQRGDQEAEMLQQCTGSCLRAAMKALGICQPQIALPWSRLAMAGRVMKRHDNANHPQRGAFGAGESTISENRRRNPTCGRRRWRSHQDVAICHPSAEAIFFAILTELIAAIPRELRPRMAKGVDRGRGLEARTLSESRRLFGRTLPDERSLAFDARCA
jgi:hypothetical protein